jgi:hypothetical protein
VGREADGREPTLSRWLTVVRSFSWWRKAPATGLLVAAAALLLAGCDSNGGTVSLPPIPTVVGGSNATTSITVSGAVNGTLASPGASCVLGGPAGVEVTIQGTVAGASYLLAFDAPSGTTDLGSATALHVVVEFAPLQGAGNWGANPSHQLGSGTLVVNAKGGTVDLHLVPGPGSSATAPPSASPSPGASPPAPAAASPSPSTPSATTVDISGSYGCSSNA